MANAKSAFVEVVYIALHFAPSLHQRRYPLMPFSARKTWFAPGSVVHLLQQAQWRETLNFLLCRDFRMDELACIVGPLLS